MITNIRKSKKQEDHLNEYFDNLYVVESFSFFNLKKNIIVLQTPIPNQNYEVKGIYNITDKENKILIHISDGTDNQAQERVPKRKNYILGIIFEISNIQNATGANNLNLNGNGKTVEIVVFNENNNNINANNIITIFTEKDPKEHGGGIIVEGP